jgi:DNA-binding response OmpR family regulator
MRVLIVEDRRRLAGVIAKGLRRAGFAVDVTYDGTTAIRLAGVNDYEVIVLDRDLPGTHGDEVCRRLTGDAVRILMLTASGSLEDRVDGLNMGADDYLSKPFAFTELVARLRALGRRGPVTATPLLSSHDLTMDTARRTVSRHDRLVELSNKEFGVLEALMAANGAVVSSEKLLEQVWDMNADPFTNTVRVTMANLRRKLGDPPLIETVRGAGYRVPA